MPIELWWHDDSKVIIRCDIKGAYTAEELYDAISTAKNMIAESGVTKHGIMDAREVTTRPKGNLIPIFRSLVSGLELETAVYVNEKGRRRLVELLVSIVFRTSRKLKVKNFRMAESVEEALEIIGSNSD